MILNDTIQQNLRRLGKITENEILLKEGDLFVAQNVITKQRRVIEKDQTIIEALNIRQAPNKRLLKS